MSTIKGILGAASSVNIDAEYDRIAHLLLEGEGIHSIFKTVRDLIVFTDFRLLFIDVTGITGKRVETLSVPYKSVTGHRYISAGPLDINSEIVLFLKGRPEVTLKLSNATAISIHTLISHFEKFA
jgi:hypothetical protein